MPQKLMLVNVVNNTSLYRNTRMPALSLAYLAAYVPKTWDVRIVDETVEKFDAFKHLHESPDIVGISGGNVCNIERILDMVGDIERFDTIMGRETAVVVGGYVGRLNMEGLPSKVDAIVKGPGELAIQRVLADFERGRLDRVYVGERLPMDELRSPDFSAFDIPAYGKNINWPVQSSVSCDNVCGFCSARSVFGDGYAARSPEKVLADLQQLPKGSRLYFTDPNLVSFSGAGLARARELFSLMAPRGHEWFGSVGFKISQEDDLLAMMKDAGCAGLLIGFDSASEASLQEMSGAKVSHRKPLLERYIDGTIKIQERYGIPVLGTFVMGFDTDDDTVFERTTRVTRESRMNDAQYLMFTPLPGTAVYNQMNADGRIFDRNLEHYDFTDVVFQPNNFSPRELRTAVVQMYEETYPRMLRLYRRLGLIRDRPGEIRVQSMQERALNAGPRGGHD